MKESSGSLAVSRAVSSLVIDTAAAAFAAAAADAGGGFFRENGFVDLVVEEKWRIAWDEK